MDRLFNERRQKHFLLLLKYWRLVFNDHFVIALFFLFGALAYGYAQLLPKIPPHNLWIRLLLVLIMVIVAQLGRFATLVKNADPVFLLPQSSRMRRYFRQALWYSCLPAELITLAGVVVILPLAMVTDRMTTILISEVVLTAVLTKWSWLKLANLQITLQFSDANWLCYLQWGGSFVIWGGTWIINPLIGLGLSILSSIISTWLVMRWSEIDWRQAVLVERNRMATVYRFFNLFTDVPNLQGHVKRRAYLNPLIRWLREDTVWHFLYGRGLVRNTEISDLVLRLTLVMAIILAFVPIIWLNSAIMVLALYLIAVQLMPLYDQYANNAFTYVYPVSTKSQIRDFKDIVRKIMIIVAVIMVLASFGTQRSFEQLIINAIIALIEVPILSTRYVQLRTKKMKKWGILNACET